MLPTQNLKISKVFGERTAYSHYVSESELEKDDPDVEGLSALEFARGNLGHSQELVDAFDGVLIEEAEAIKDFIEEQKKLAEDALLNIREAYEASDAKSACIQARLLRTSIACIESVHPLLLDEKLLRSSIFWLGKSYEKFVSKSDVSRHYTRNILLRKLALELTLQLVEESIPSQEIYSKRYLELAKEL